MPRQGIEVEVSAGIVELTGQAPNLLARERAALLAEGVKGVRSVSTRLVLPAIDRSDADIQESIRRELAADAAFEGTAVQVEVNEGIATLRGTVDSWVEKEAASRQSKRIKGVRGVVNLLTIAYAASRSDQEIQSDVEKKLFWDALVDEELLDVSVADGRVILSGIVGSAAEVRRASNDAWVNGAMGVDTESR